MSRRLTLLALAIAALPAVACTNPLAVGEECSDSADCMEGSSCFFADVESTRSVCMTDCDGDAMHVCAGGEVCIQSLDADGLPRELDVCFIGGDVAVGDPCTDTRECERGALCVTVSGVSTCERACVDGDGRCGSGEVCEELIGMPGKGFCAPAP